MFEGCNIDFSISNERVADVWQKLYKAFVFSDLFPGANIIPGSFLDLNVWNLREWYTLIKKWTAYSIVKGDSDFVCETLDPFDEKLICFSFSQYDLDEIHLWNKVRGILSEIPTPEEDLYEKLLEEIVYRRVNISWLSAELDDRLELLEAIVLYPWAPIYAISLAKIRWLFYVVDTWLNGESDIYFTRQELDTLAASI